jgi:hypothetical protein
MNRNNNICNVKNDPADRWNDVGGECASRTDARGHAVFVDPAFSARAADICYQEKWENGKRSLLALCRDWAPESDTEGSLPGRPKNDPVAYALFIAKRASLGIYEELPAPKDNILTWCRIQLAMARWEMGEDCPMSTILRGAAMFMEKVEAGHI